MVNWCQGYPIGYNSSMKYLEKLIEWLGQDGDRELVLSPPESNPAVGDDGWTIALFFGDQDREITAATLEEAARLMLVELSLN